MCAFSITLFVLTSLDVWSSVGTEMVNVLITFILALTMDKSKRLFSCSI